MRNWTWSTCLVSRVIFNFFFPNYCVLVHTGGWVSRADGRKPDWSGTTGSGKAGKGHQVLLVLSWLLIPAAGFRMGTNPAWNHSKLNNSDKNSDENSDKNSDKNSDNSMLLFGILKSTKKNNFTLLSPPWIPVQGVGGENGSCQLFQREAR